MQSLAKKSGKLEKKANLLMNGYQAKCQQQEKERLTKKSLILEREITIGSFESMFVHEESGGVSRLENLSLEVFFTF